MSSSRRALAFTALSMLAGVSSGCLVSKAKYEECLSGAALVRSESQAKQASDHAELRGLQEQLASAEAATQDRDSKLSEVSTAGHNLQAQLDQATAMNQQLRGELSRLGQDVDKVLADRGTLSKALEDAKARLDELRKAQAVAEEHAQIFRDVAQRLKRLIDAGQLRIESRRGRLVMNINGDLLFDEGRADVRAAGKGILMEVAHALAASATPKSDRRFLVTAHVDEESLKQHHFKSAWDLTTARAVAVVEYLVSLRVPPESLTAAGAGSFDRLAANDSPDARSKNRRLEIALVPTAEEAVVAASSAK